MTISLPELEGVLVTDEATLTACARDYGRVVHRMPSAVLRPAGARDVVVASYAISGYRQGLVVGTLSLGGFAPGEAKPFDLIFTYHWGEGGGPGEAFRVNFYAFTLSPAAAQDSAGPL